MTDAVALDRPAADHPAAPRTSLAREALAFMGLAGPMIVSRIGVAAMGIADGVMVARFSAEQLAVLGLADAMMSRIIDIAIVFATAGLALAAQARAGDADAQRGVGRVWQTSLWLALLAGGFGMLLSFTGEPLLRALGQPDQLVPDAARMMFILGLSVIPALVAVTSAGLLEAMGRPIGVAVVVVLANLLNVALNAVAIFGWNGVPAMGAEGAAWSTLVVRTLLAALLAGGVWWMAERERYGIRARYTRADWRAGGEQRARGWAGAANIGVLATLSLVLPVMAGWMGASAVAQITALWLAMAPAMIVAWGMGDAAGLRVAALRGARNGQGLLRLTGARLSTVLLGVVLLAAAAYLLAPEAMAGWAAHDPALTAAIVPLLPLGIASIATDAMSILYSAMLRSLGVLKAPLVLHVVTGLAMLPLAWYFAFPVGWGVAGLLFAQAVVAIVRALALAGLYDRHAAALDAADVDRAAAAA